MTYINKEAKHLTRKTFLKRISDYCNDNEILILSVIAISVLGFTAWNIIDFFWSAI